MSLPSVTRPATGALAQVIERASDPERFTRWEQLVAQTGHCSHPIRLVGRVTAVDTATGEARTHYDTANEPDGELLVACNNRRASVCPSCSATYQADTWHLVAAGLRGGKGTPETVVEHPRLFVTQTAPGFGPVHTRRERRGRVLPCRARRRFSVCPHGRADSCRERHRQDDFRLGTPLCPDCYDYEGAVLFNAYAPELWRRFTVYVYRDLARLAGLTVKQLRRHVRIRFAKVAEGQKRGLVHFHAVIRLDGLDPADPQRVIPPPPEFTADMLDQAVREATERVRVTTPPPSKGAPGVELRFGTQLDVRHLTHRPDEGELDEHTVAAYLAKYVTKATSYSGISDHRLRRDDLDRLDPAKHLDRMALTAWALGALPQLEERMLRRWAHMLGFRGHVATRSRAYSTTLGALRRARRDFRIKQKYGEQGPRDPWGRPLRGSDDDPDDEPTTLLVGDWRFSGSGHRSIGDAWLAEAAAARAREHKEWRKVDALAFGSAR